MRQLTLASQGRFERYGKKTRREEFLEEMDGIMPWSELESLIEPHYPKEGNGRPQVGLRIMLRGYFLQHWFNLSDPAAEEALYDSPALRRFAGVDLGRGPAPDETTILNFRHLLEKHDLHCDRICTYVRPIDFDDEGPRRPLARLQRQDIDPPCQLRACGTPACHEDPFPTNETPTRPAL